MSFFHGDFILTRDRESSNHRSNKPISTPGILAITSNPKDAKTSHRRSYSGGRFGSSGSSSPPPLCQSASTCTSTTSLSSSPPGSPNSSFSARMSSGIQTTTSTSDRYTSGGSCGSFSSNRPLSPHTHGRLSPTSGITNAGHRNIGQHRLAVMNTTPQSPSKSWDEGDDHPDNFRSNVSAGRLSNLQTSQHSFSPTPHFNAASSPDRHIATPASTIPITRAQSDITASFSASSPTLSPSLRPRYNLNPRLSGSVGGLQFRGQAMTMFTVENDPNLFTPDSILPRSDCIERRSTPVGHNLLNIDPPKSPIILVDIQKQRRVNSLQETFQQQLQKRPPTPTRESNIGKPAVQEIASSSPMVVSEDDISSLGGFEDVGSTSSKQQAHSISNQSLMRLVFAIRSNSDKPANLSGEENCLWEAVQAALRQARQEKVVSSSSSGSTGVTATELSSRIQNGTSKAFSIVASKTSSCITSKRNVHAEPVSPPHPFKSSNDCNPINNFSELNPRPPSFEQALAPVSTSSFCTNEAQLLALKQQEENSRSLVAIQRALADVQAERDKAVEQLLDLKQVSTSANNLSIGFTSSINSCEIDSLVDLQQREEINSLKRELQLASERIKQFERDQALESNSLPLLPENKTHYNQSQRSTSKNLNSTNIDVHNQRGDDRMVESTTSVDLINELRNDLNSKTSALENAKMIITSLENASNTLAADLRAKIRAKDDELTKIKKEAADRQRTLDALAMELRDLQCTRARNTGFVVSDAERFRRLALSGRLEKNMADVRAITVVLESTQDPTNFQALGDLLADSLDALTQGIAMMDDFADDGSDGSVVSNNEGFGGSCPRFKSSKNSDNEAIRKLRIELDDTKKVVKQLEESIRKYKDEIKRLRSQVENCRLQRDEEVQSLQAEVKILRRQCNTNMEVLTKKERELAVLRDSLQVEDVGYISDDNSEGDDDDDNGEQNDDNSSLVRETPPRQHQSKAASADYSPSQAEALATLLAQGVVGSNRSFDLPSRTYSFDTIAVQNQIESLQKELARARGEHEKLRREMKVDKESLSNAKMIIASLERANKSMMEDLRSRLQDSNSAIACLLEKSLESEKTSTRLRSELEEALHRERERTNNIVTEQPSSSCHLVATTTHAFMELPIETID